VPTPIVMGIDRHVLAAVEKRALSSIVCWDSVLSPRA